MFLILDDHPIARKGLESIIHMYRPEDEVLQAGTVKEAIESMRGKKVDMAFIDLNLNGENGLDFLKWLKKEREEVKTIFIHHLQESRIFCRQRRWG